MTVLEMKLEKVPVPVSGVEQKLSTKRLDFSSMLIRDRLAGKS